jgi:hypothetical protein
LTGSYGRADDGCGRRRDTVNIQQLKKKVGSNVKIRPIAIRRDPFTGAVLPPIDDLWRLGYAETRRRFTIQNTRTDHIVYLANDTIREFRDTYANFGHLRIASRITLSGPHADQEPLFGP